MLRYHVETCGPRAKIHPLVCANLQDDKRGFLERVEACVRESQETVYENEEGSSLRFTEPKPAHVRSCYTSRLTRGGRGSGCSVACFKR